MQESRVAKIKQISIDQVLRNIDKLLWEINCTRVLSGTIHFKIIEDAKNLCPDLIISHYNSGLRTIEQSLNGLGPSPTKTAPNPQVFLVPTDFSQASLSTVNCTLPK